MLLAVGSRGKRPTNNLEQLQITHISSSYPEKVTGPAARTIEGAAVFGIRREISL